MKKIAVLLSLVAFVFAFSSCGGPKADAKKMMNKQESLAKMQKKAAEDGKLDDGEIDKIVKEFKSFMDLSKELEEKYKEDSAGKKEMQDEMEVLQKEFQEEYKDVDYSDVENYDKLQEKMFEVMFSDQEEEK